MGGVSGSNTNNEPSASEEISTMNKTYPQQLNSSPADDKLLVIHDLTHMQDAQALISPGSVTGSQKVDAQEMTSRQHGPRPENHDMAMHSGNSTSNKTLLSAAEKETLLSRTLELSKGLLESIMGSESKKDEENDRGSTAAAVSYNYRSNQNNLQAIPETREEPDARQYKRAKENRTVEREGPDTRQYNRPKENRSLDFRI